MYIINKDNIETLTPAPFNLKGQNRQQGPTAFDGIPIIGCSTLTAHSILFIYSYRSTFIYSHSRYFSSSFFLATTSSIASPIPTSLKDKGSYNTIQPYKLYVVVLLPGFKSLQPSFSSMANACPLFCPHARTYTISSCQNSLSVFP